MWAKGTGKYIRGGSKTAYHRARRDKGRISKAKTKCQDEKSRLTTYIINPPLSTHLPWGSIRRLDGKFATHLWCTARSSASSWRPSTSTTSEFVHSSISLASKPIILPVSSRKIFPKPVGMHGSSSTISIAGDTGDGSWILVSVGLSNPPCAKGFRLRVKPSFA